MIEIISINDGLEAGTATVITEEVGSTMRIERAMEIAQHATSFIGGTAAAAPTGFGDLCQDHRLYREDCASIETFSRHGANLILAAARLATERAASAPRCRRAVPCRREQKRNDW